jgi:histidine triad (HIT) family protein
MAGDCIFCKIAEGQIPSTAVYSDDEFYAFRDIHPLAPTHILIIPRKHVAKVTDVTEADAGLLGRLLLAANRVAAQEGIAESGFRLVINCGPWGGQAVDHLHLHVLGGRRLEDGLG